MLHRQGCQVSPHWAQEQAQYDTKKLSDQSYFNIGFLGENIEKQSPSLGRDAQYVKSMAITRLPGYITIQMVRFHFKQKEAVNAKVLKDVKFPVMLDMFEMCSKELQERLVPRRTQFKEYEDWLVHQV